MQDRLHAIRAEQDHVAFNQWHSRRMTCGSAGRATSGARRVPPELPCGAFFSGSLRRSGRVICGGVSLPQEDQRSSRRTSAGPRLPCSVVSASRSPRREVRASWESTKKLRRTPGGIASPAPWSGEPWPSQCSWWATTLLLFCCGCAMSNDGNTSRRNMVRR